MTENLRKPADNADSAIYSTGDQVRYKYSASVMMYRFNDDNALEFAMMLRDDYPAWVRVGAGGVEPDEETDMFRAAVREAEEETNFPLRDHLKAIQFVATMQLFDVHTGELRSENHTWAINIGNFPLELGNEGIALQFFTLANMPPNISAHMLSFITHTGSCIDPVTQSVIGTPEDDLPVPIAFHGQYQPFASLHRSRYVGLDDFYSNNIVAKRVENASIAVVMNDVLQNKEDLKPFGLLRFDPMTPAVIIQAFENFTAGEDDTKTLRQISAERHAGLRL